MSASINLFLPQSYLPKDFQRLVEKQEGGHYNIDTKKGRICSSGACMYFYGSQLKETDNSIYELAIELSSNLQANQLAIDFLNKLKDQTKFDFEFCSWQLIDTRNIPFQVDKTLLSNRFYLFFNISQFGSDIYVKNKIDELTNKDQLKFFNKDLILSTGVERLIKFHGGNSYILNKKKINGIFRYFELKKDYKLLDEYENLISCIHKFFPEIDLYLYAIFSMKISSEELQMFKQELLQFK